MSQTETKKGKTAMRHTLIALLALAAALPALAKEPIMHTDKTFPARDDVVCRPVRYPNRFDIQLAGDLYLPKGLDEGKRHPAVIVGHPYGGVKEQCAGLYAQELAARGFVALAFDLSYAGESGGTPRQTVSPETYAEDFSASVDFLGLLPFVDRGRIGVVGICGSGGFALSAAAVDPRLRAIVTVSMYDMGRATYRGGDDRLTDAARRRQLEDYAALRWEEAARNAAAPALRFGTPETLPEGAPQPVREFYAYYRERAWHPNYKGQKLTSMPALMNWDPFLHIADVSPRPILFVVGEKAHSKYFSDDAYARAAEPKRMLVVPGATHVDLYDDRAKIPFDAIEAFLRESLPAQP